MRNQTAAAFCARPRIELLNCICTSRRILGHASQLALRYPLRAYDAIHLATALEFERDSDVGLPAPIFVSADTNLLAAARAEGLAVENPNEHE